MPDTEASKFLKTYSTFKAKDKDNESIIEYKIQDIAEDRFNDAIRMLIEATKEEPLCSSRNVYENENTKNELVRIWTAILKARLSVGCFKDDGEMVGFNVLTIKNKGEESLFVSEDTNIRDMMDNLAQIHKEIDVFTNFNVDSYLTSLGLTVNPAYQDKGIASELLKTRLQIMKNLGLTLSVTTFTSLASQTAAKNAGFEEIFVTTYDKLKERGFDFVNEFSDLYKIMAMKL